MATAGAKRRSSRKKISWGTSRSASFSLLGTLRRGSVLGTVVVGMSGSEVPVQGRNCHSADDHVDL